MAGDVGQSSAGSSNASELLLTDHGSVFEHPGVGNRLWLIIAAVVGLGVMLGLGWANHQERAALVALIDRLEQKMAAGHSQGDLTTEEEKALKIANQSLQLELDSVKRRLETLSAEWAAQRDDSESAVLTTSGLNNAATNLTPNNESRTNSPVITTESPVALPTTLEVESSETETIQAADTTTRSGESAEGARQNATSNGRWFVNFGTYSEKEGAEALLETVVGALPLAKLYAVDIKNTPMWRIQAQGYASKEEAKSIAADIQARLGITGLWVGEAEPNNSNTPKTMNTTGKVSSGASSPKALTEGAQLSLPEGWFIYVDTYTTEQKARQVTQAIETDGYNAKIAVEHRNGQLYYRVQVIGLKTRAEGEAAVHTLAKANEFPNLQLRRY